MRWLTTLAAAFTLVLGGCGGRKDGAEGESGGEAIRKQTIAAADDSAPAARTWPADAPPQFTCAADADCTVAVSGPGGPDPCCDITFTALPVSTSWLRFMEAWRVPRCRDVRCPSLTLPGAQLAECGYQPRCVDQKCTDACNQIPEPTYASSLPPGAPSRLGCRTHADCVLIPNAPSAKNGCCDGPATPTPISREHFEAVYMMRAFGCKDVQCPPRDTRAVEVAACAREPRCVKRTCTDACKPVK